MKNYIHVQLSICSSFLTVLSWHGDLHAEHFSKHKIMYDWDDMMMRTIIKHPWINSLLAKIDKKCIDKNGINAESSNYNCSEGSHLV